MSHCKHNSDAFTDALEGRDVWSRGHRMSLMKVYKQGRIQYQVWRGVITVGGGGVYIS